MPDQATDREAPRPSDARPRNARFLDSMATALTSGLDVIASHAADMVSDRLTDRARGYLKGMAVRSLGLVAAILALIWLSLGLSAYLETMMPDWAACLAVALIFTLLAVALMIWPVRIDGNGATSSETNRKEFENGSKEIQNSKEDRESD